MRSLIQTSDLFIHFCFCRPDFMWKQTSEGEGLLADLENLENIVLDIVISRNLNLRKNDLETLENYFHLILYFSWCIHVVL